MAKNLGINLACVRAGTATGIEKFVETVVRKMPLFSSSHIAMPRNVEENFKYQNLVENSENRIKITYTPKLSTSLRIIYEMIVLSIAFFRCSHILSVNNFGPIFGRRGQIRTTVIHDVWFLSPFYEGGKIRKWLFKRLIKIQLNFTHKIITVSEFSKSEIVKYLGVEKVHIEVVPNCIATQFNDIEYAPEVGGKYFVLIGSDRENKNIKRALLGYSKYWEESKTPLLLIVVGPYSDAFKKQMLDRLNDQIAISWLGYVSRKRLENIMYYSSGIFFPSTYEGFGIPVIEAIHVKKPILISKNTACSEFSGEGIIAVDGFSTDDITNGLHQLECLQGKKIDFERLQKKIFGCVECAEKLQNIVLDEK